MRLKPLLSAYSHGLAVTCIVAMWCSAGRAMAVTIVPQPDGITRIDQSSVYVTVPVYVSSIIATAVATWTIAKYDSARIRRQDAIIARLKTLEDKDAHP